MRVPFPQLGRIGIIAKNFQRREVHGRHRCRILKAPIPKSPWQRHAWKSLFLSLREIRWVEITARDFLEFIVQRAKTFSHQREENTWRDSSRQYRLYISDKKASWFYSREYIIFNIFPTVKSALPFCLIFSLIADRSFIRIWFFLFVSWSLLKKLNLYWLDLIKGASRNFKCVLTISPLRSIKTSWKSLVRA